MYSTFELSFKHYILSLLNLPIFKQIIWNEYLKKIVVNFLSLTFFKFTWFGICQKETALYISKRII